MAIKALIRWLGFYMAVEAPPEVRAQFKLFFEDLLVGTFRLPIHYGGSNTQANLRNEMS
jgi:hypothetical protein